MAIGFSVAWLWIGAIVTILLFMRGTVLLVFIAWRWRTPRQPPGGTVRTLVVLGSGGHTAEMLRLTEGMDHKRYRPWFYVLAETDKTSLSKVATTESAARIRTADDKNVFRIPRSREVGQSWFSSVISTLYASIWAFFVTARLQPNLVLANGPGTCLPICVAAFALRVLGLGDARIVFCESFCRVKSLSLTGKLLYPIADRFIVHWPELTEKYRRAEYIGVLC